MRLIDDIMADIKKLESEQTETDRVARSAFIRVEDVEDKLAALKLVVSKVEDQADVSTLSIADIRAVSRTVGLLSGAVTGVLASVLVAFILKALHIN